MQIRPLHFVIAHRKPRGGDLIEAADCTYRLLSVITLYLDFAGNHFDQQRFNTTIDTILRTGSTGTANNDPAAEQALIDGVMAWRSEIQQNRAQLRQAFQEAAQLNASTIGFATGQFGTQPSTSTEPQPGPSGQASSGATATGRYELDLTATNLAQFRQQYPEVLPRIRHNDQWVSSSDHFMVDILNSSNYSGLTEIHNMLDKEWYPESSTPSTSFNENFGPVVFTGNAPTCPSDLLEHGYEIAEQIMMSMLMPDPDEVFFVVRFQNRPVSILVGHLNRDEHTARIMYSVSHPDSLRIPYINSAVRGAGQRAVQRFIEYALEQNMRRMTSYVVSTSSAIVKQKFGFNHQKR